MLRDLAADLRATVDETNHPGWQFWLRAIGKLVIAPSMQVVVLYRLSHAIFHVPGLRLPSFLLRSWATLVGGAEIHPEATIGPGFALVHSVGVVIGAGTVIGADCRLSQGVTLGEAGRGSESGPVGFPRIGDGVTIGANAVILGGLEIGDGAVIGANAVVTKDVDAGWMVAGVPAKPIRRVQDFEER